MTESAEQEWIALHDAEVLPLEQAAYRHEQNGELEESFRLRREALAKLETIVEPVSDLLASTIEGLAIDLNNDGRYEEAEALFLRSLAMYETLYGPVHLEVAGVLTWLGYLYDDWERYDQSLPIYRRALTIEETQCGTYSPEAATTCTWLGDAHKELGQYAEAEAYLQRALLVWRTRQAVEGTAQLLLTEERPAFVLFRLKRYCDALAAYQDVQSLNNGRFRWAQSRRRYKTCVAKCAPKVAAGVN